MDSTFSSSSGDGDDYFIISVPASSANLGPGFDCFALGLSPRLELHCRLEADCLSQESITLCDISKVSLPQNIKMTRDNLIIKVAENFAKTKGLLLLEVGKRLHIEIDNKIPIGKGFGSSAAAVIAGLALASRVLNLKLEKAELAQLAIEFEEHYDNIAAAVFGGFCLVIHPIDRGGVPKIINISWPDELGLILWVPEYQLSTELARKVLPSSYTRGETVGNLSRASGLVASILKNDYEHLAICLKDQLHQEYRAQLLPELGNILGENDATVQTISGLVGFCLSGAGPSILAIYIKSQANPSILEEIEGTFNKAGLVSGKVLPVSADLEGLKILNP